MYHKGRVDEFEYHFGKIEDYHPKEIYDIKKKANGYYKRLYKVIKKYNKYISGKGKPLNQEEMDIYFEYLTRVYEQAKEDNEKRIFKLLLDQISYFI